MKLNSFIEAMNSLAPTETALGFDNCGLIIGTERSEIHRVLVALDCTVPVAEEAIEKGCDLVLTHHPLMFSAVKRILPDAPETAAVYKLIRAGIALFSAHTNLDAAEGGVNTELCRLLGIKNEAPVAPENIMRIGEIDEPTALDDFAQLVEKKLNTRVLISGKNCPVKRIAVLGGSGGSDCELAKMHGADCLVTGECKHSQAIEASVLGLSLIVAGHYETENPVLIPLIEYLKKSTTDIEYVLSESASPIFRCAQ